MQYAFSIPELLYEEGSFGVFLLVSVVLGGGAAALAGRAVAATWRPAWQVAAYMFVLGGAVRFFHFALFDGTLLSLHYYLVDCLVCLAAGASASAPSGLARWSRNIAGSTAAAGRCAGAAKRPDVTSGQVSALKRGEHG